MLVNESVSRFGKIDILVNNAGVVEDAPALGMTDEAWAKVLGVNLTGVFHMCRAAAKHMMFQRYGRIVNVSSFVARVGNKGQANYAASKGGLDAMTRTLAIELGPKGITVNAVAPGCIETEMSQNSVLGFKDKLLPRIPVKRIGKPEEVASLVHYLVQEEAGYITGEVIGVTGGLGLWVL